MQFSTKPYDEKTGLSYYGYRYYSPTLGRWITRDPIGERGGINLYGFSNDNPVNFIDPYGDHPAWVICTAWILMGGQVLEIVHYVCHPFDPPPDPHCEKEDKLPIPGNDKKCRRRCLPRLFPPAPPGR